MFGVRGLCRNGVPDAVDLLQLSMGFQDDEGFRQLFRLVLALAGPWVGLVGEARGFGVNKEALNGEWSRVISVGGHYFAGLVQEGGLFDFAAEQVQGERMLGPREDAQQTGLCAVPILPDETVQGAPEPVEVYGVVTGVAVPLGILTVPEGFVRGELFVIRVFLVLGGMAHNTLVFWCVC